MCNAMETKHAYCKLIHAVLTNFNRQFVEGVQSNISISTIYHMGIAKTPDKKHNVYMTKQYGKTEDKIQSSKNRNRQGVSKGPAQSPLTYKFGSKYPS
jgi:intergrase/recombinase